MATIDFFGSQLTKLAVVERLFRQFGKRFSGHRCCGEVVLSGGSSKVIMKLLPGSKLALKFMCHHTSQNVKPLLRLAQCRSSIGVSELPCHFL